MFRRSLFLAISFILTFETSADIVRKYNLPKLVSESELIIVGKIIEKKPMQDDGGRLKTTILTVKVLRIVKGDGELVDKTITIENFGTNMDDIVQEQTVHPKFVVGERAVLFLNHWRESMYSVLGGFLELQQKNGHIVKFKPPSSWL